ncbi:MAG: lysophospholipid acyltransferase family protein [Deltaproteobacteria bacterium]|nr:lysophospholipid acyltransferase family protein [Deltaproteobacteria bacterium]
MRGLWHRLVLRLGPCVAFSLIKFLQGTMRIEELNGELVRDLWTKGENIIIAFWHGRLLMMPLVYRGEGVKVMVSRHRDGELINRTIQLFGFETVRGSTTRGGLSGIRGLVRALKEGYDVAIAPDGPRGPRYQVQAGVIQLAKISGCPILPLAFSASSRKILRTWDRFLIPYPFSRGVFVWGEPIWVNPEAGEEEMEQKSLLLEGRLEEITELADCYFERVDSSPRKRQN